MELGPEIAINGARPEWLEDDEGVGIVWRGGKRWDHLKTPADCVSGWEHSVAAIRLRADHPYYLATSKGFKYWPGGESAPGDWDGGAVLYACGGMQGEGYAEDWIASNWARIGAPGCIIGYRPCSDPNASHIDPKPTEDDSDYVRVKRMTAREYQTNDTGSLSWARRVGLIREETLLEQFEREQPRMMSEREREHVREALEWMETRNA